MIWQRLKRHDTYDPLYLQLKENGAPANLTGATSVLLTMKLEDAATAKVNAQMTVVDAAQGLVQYSWLPADVDTAGNYQAEVEVIRPTSKPKTWPTKGVGRVIIEADLNNAGAP